MPRRPLNVCLLSAGAGGCLAEAAVRRDRVAGVLEGALHVLAQDEHDEHDDGGDGGDEQAVLHSGGAFVVAALTERPDVVEHGYSSSWIAQATGWPCAEPPSSPAR